MKLQFVYNRITRERLFGAIEGLSIDELTKKTCWFQQQYTLEFWSYFGNSAFVMF